MKSLAAWLAKRKKAIAGLVAPGVPLLGLALTAGSSGGESVTPGEWKGIASAMIVGALAVYFTPKNAVPPEPVEGDGGPGMAAG